MGVRGKVLTITGDSVTEKLIIILLLRCILIADHSPPWSLSEPVDHSFMVAGLSVLSRGGQLRCRGFTSKKECQMAGLCWFANFILARYAGYGRPLKPCLMVKSLSMCAPGGEPGTTIRIIHNCGLAEI